MALLSWVDLDSNLGPKSSKRLAFGVAAVATIILETFDIQGEIKIKNYRNIWAAGTPQKLKGHLLVWKKCVTLV
jgi:hypothetical protein